MSYPHKLLNLLVNIRGSGGDGGIRTLDRALQPYNGLANRRLQPLGHISVSSALGLLGGARRFAHMPERRADGKGLDRSNGICFEPDLGYYCASLDVWL